MRAPPWKNAITRFPNRALLNSVFCILLFFLPFPLHSVFWFCMLRSCSLTNSSWDGGLGFLSFCDVDSGFWERACILRLCILRFCHPRQSWNGAQFGFGTYEMAHSQGDILEVSLSTSQNRRHLDVAVFCETCFLRCWMDGRSTRPIFNINI